MTQSSFKDRFSLDYLTPPSNLSNSGGTTSSSTFVGNSASNSFSGNQLPPGMEAVLRSIGVQVLATIQSASQQKSTLLEISQARSMRLEAILPVLEYLSGQGLVERVVADPSGNDTYQLTPAGRESQLA